ncbi:major facilitator superfamily MFS, ACS family [Cupriavidus necator N-1]|uniref:Major facilitator superfamily MFS, ACS family n=1 Tax=Cupriavidus necator (strain ATCC 43291 / DSM 13513 / CCUG 52238 / LMG 8453 / N-1) TaxID=1042878 RepID=F8GQ03_CUPNN|nr:MFS transporter [Cupriavidus necator]AEI79356.1 major facilitator superfamily MFS, ACS family [Cupriavidus necator N-1]KAI3601725.1 putative MFS-type transporter [Cupriavidus necator H850]MDX6010997.1 MFS transporter [Cupriavidus necator]
MLVISSESAVDDTPTLYNKINWRLLPFLLICYLFAYLDRVNIGFAKLQMQGDLGFSDAAYGVGAGIFFIGYVLFEIPSNLMLPRIGARKTFSRILVLWGITSACMLFVRNVPMFYAMRFLLGIFEAGFAPGMIYYLSCWYGPQRMARAIAIVFLAGPLGGIVGGPVSAWLITALSGTGGLAGWQWMFLVEGLPCILLGVLALYFVPNRPADAAWLTEQEKRLLANEIGSSAAHNHSFLAVARDVRVYVLALAYFCIIAAIYAISFWLPTFIKAQGVNDTVQLGWYSALPYVAAAFGMYYMGRRSDRVGERRFHSAVPATVGGLLLAASILVDGNLAASLVLLTLGTCALWMAYTVFWAMPSEYIKGPAAAGGIALINTIGLSGGFWGPAIIGWAKTATGNLHLGVLILSALPIIAALIILANKLPAKR